MSMENAKYEFMCMDKIIQYYKWLFEVKDEEEAKEKVSTTTKIFVGNKKYVGLIQNNNYIDRRQKFYFF